MRPSMLKLPTGAVADTADIEHVPAAYHALQCHFVARQRAGLSEQITVTEPSASTAVAGGGQWHCAAPSAVRPMPASPSRSPAGLPNGRSGQCHYHGEHFGWGMVAPERAQHEGCRRGGRGLPAPAPGRKLSIWRSSGVERLPMPASISLIFPSSVRSPVATTCAASFGRTRPPYRNRPPPKRSPSGASKPLSA